LLKREQFLQIEIIRVSERRHGWKLTKRIESGNQEIRNGGTRFRMSRTRKSASLRPISAPLGETRTSRRDCSGSLRLLPRKHHRRYRTIREYFRAFRHHDYTRAPPRYAFRSIVDLTTLRSFSPPPQIGGKSVCSV